MGLTWGGPYTQDTGNPTDGYSLPAYPANARAERQDQANWMDEEHDNVNGRHKFIQCTVTQRTSDILFGQTPAQTNPGMIVLHTGMISAVDPTNTVWVDYGTFVTGDIKLCAYNTVSAIDGWLACTGQAVSRTTYANLFATITFSMTASAGSGTTTVTVASTAGLFVGLPVFGSGIFAGSTIASVTSGTTFTLSHVTTGTVTSVFFAPFGNGDGSSTFNVPNMGGIAPVGYISGGDTSDGSKDYAGVGAAYGAKKPTPVIASFTGVTGNDNQAGIAGVQTGGIFNAAITPHNHNMNHTHTMSALDVRQPSITVGYLIKT
jgi:microcystin-dependent protein